MKAWAKLAGHWSALQARERQALSLMAAVLLVASAWLLAWQPSRAYLAHAREAYQAQLRLASQAARAAPWQAEAGRGGPPAPSVLQEAAAAAGLRVIGFEVDSSQLRLTVSGESALLLGWLRQMEAQGLQLETLRLNAEGGELQLGLSARLP